MVRKLKPAESREEAARAPRSLRILVADDDRHTVLTLMTILRHDGDDVRGVHKGADVVKALADFEPDAVLLDIHMPDLSGYEVARRIRGTRGGDGILLIGISGVYRQASDVLLSRVVGFDHYLTKPYDTTDILRLLAPLRLPSPDA